MTLFSPQALWLLLALPALVAGYAFLLRRRKVSRLRMADLAIVREALGPRNRARYIPPALLLVSIATAIIAIARPATVLALPGFEETVILTLDVSASMQAADVEPSRLVAAQHAAKAFVAGVPRNVRIGIVSFAGTAAIVQGPTLDHRQLEDAIDGLKLGPSTNLHGGIALSLAAMFPDDGIELEQFTDSRSASRALERPPQPSHRTGRS